MPRSALVAEQCSRLRPLESIGRYGMSRSIAGPLGFTRKDCAVHVGVHPIVSVPLPVVVAGFWPQLKSRRSPRGTTPGVRARQALSRTTACAAGCVLCGDMTHSLRLPRALATRGRSGQREQGPRRTRRISWRHVSVIIHVSHVSRTCVGRGDCRAHRSSLQAGPGIPARSRQAWTHSWGREPEMATWLVSWWSTSTHSTTH
jgi:hypothetical protein